MIVNGAYFDKLKKLLDSPLYQCLKVMPKAAVHHTHITACADADFLVKLTYNDFVFYSEKEDLFYTNQRGCTLPGYLKVNTLRQYAKDAVQFDQMIREKVMINPKQPEDHAIWQEF